MEDGVRPGQAHLEGVSLHPERIAKVNTVVLGSRRIPVDEIQRLL
ncbi:hypothetical protein TNCT_362191, partial [Trichonephila clavata]